MTANSKLCCYQLPLLLLLLLLVSTLRVDAFGSGAPAHRCSNLVPMHPGSPQASPPPYELVTTAAAYSPGDIVNVTLRGLNGRKFKGFAITARRTSGDTEELIGKFLPAGNGKQLAWYSPATTDMNCITHRTPASKSDVTVQWMAPARSVGDVMFTTPVVESLNEFWSNVSSKFVTARQPSQDPPFPELQRGRNGAMVGRCGSEIGCVTTPAGCSVDGSCDAQLKFQAAGDNLTIEMQAAGSWIAVGFSDDDRMKDDLTVTCTSREQYSIHIGYNPSNAYRNERHRWTQLTNKKIDAADGKLWCQFTMPLSIIIRTIINIREDTEPVERKFDLKQEMFIFLAYGQTYSGSSTVSQHQETPGISSTKVHLLSQRHYTAHRIFGYKKGHGSLMILSWIFLAPLGANLALFYRKIFLRPMWGVQVWFHLHRLLVTSGYLLSIVGILLMFAAYDWAWPAVNARSFAHAVMGFMVIGLATGQIFMGVLRPDKDAPKRWLFKLMHNIFGYAILSIVDANFLTIGFLMTLPFGYRVLHNVMGFSWLAFNITFRIVMPIVIKRFDKDRSSDETPDKDKGESEAREKKILKILFTVYVTGAAAFVLVVFIGLQIY